MLLGIDLIKGLCPFKPSKASGKLSRQTELKTTHFNVLFGSAALVQEIERETERKTERGISLGT